MTDCLVALRLMNFSLNPMATMNWLKYSRKLKSHPATSVHWPIESLVGDTLEFILGLKYDAE
jgi:hypothetical protein